MYSSTNINKKSKLKKRAQISMTTEVLAKLLCLNDDAYVETALINKARNIVTFYLKGEGLKEYSDSKWLECSEGQECVEISIPALEQALK